MKITHLRHVALVTPDHERSRAFFREAWGLRDAGVEGGVAFLRAQDAEPFALALHPGPVRRIERIAFGLTGVDAVAEAARHLERAGVALLGPPIDLSTPGGGRAIRFRDPDGRCIELSGGVAAGDTSTAPAVPRKLAHIVVNTPNIDRATRFFGDVLGFRISDWSEHQMSFLRCDAEHHAIAFNQAAHPSYNHTSWTMSSIDELFRAQGRVRKWGTPLMWGTGRHGPGNQVFNYFIEPSGYVVEAIADGIAIDDEAAWEPRVWVRSPEFMDLWGTSGPPCEEIRAAMAGVPE